MAISLTESQWESIVVAILTGESEGLSTILAAVDKASGLTRRYLWIKWLDLTAPKRIDGLLVQDWPPTETAGVFISYSAFTKDFVEDYVSNQTSRSAYTLCTDDKNGEVGWKELDIFFP